MASTPSQHLRIMRRNVTSGALNPIPESFRKLWDVWDLRVCVLSSLGLQTFLILFGSRRKQSGSKFGITPIIWSAYLLADWVAAFALGLISNNNDNGADSIKTDDLLAFWAPFLLLHLGGPDTITAFALEDNELWIRHLLGLVFQFLAAGYIFFQTLPDNQLWVGTLLMFLAGLVKYAERTRSLYLASLGRFRDSLIPNPDPGPNYAKLMAEYSSMQKANLPAEIVMITEPEASSNSDNQRTTSLGKKEKVQRAYDFFQTFKGLIVDMIFSFHDRSQSRDFFLQINTEDAFEIVEIELSFIYEVLYTKAVILHSRSGYFLRFVAFSSVVTSLVLFLSYKKLHLPEIDVTITYMLLIGAIILDIIALVMLIFSDRTIASNRGGSRVNNIISAIVTQVPIPRTPRWSESVSQFNFITYTLSKRTNFVDPIVDDFGLKDLVDEIRYASSVTVTMELKEFIFRHIRNKSIFAQDPKSAKETSSARGDRVLARSMYRELLAWSVEVDFDESLLLWHIATEIVYHKNEDDKTQDTNDHRHRKLSKLVSDYMLYLLIMQPTMMLGVGGIGRIRFRDTCAEANVFYRGLQRNEPEHVCDKLFEVNTAIKPAEVKGDRSKSVLFDAVILAKKLQKLQDEVAQEKRWELISQVWLELLCYAAIQCRGNSHAQQLSKGGQLLTFVWLLMTHLGFGEQFRIETGHGRAKLIVET